MTLQSFSPGLASAVAVVKVLASGIPSLGNNLPRTSLMLNMLPAALAMPAPAMAPIAVPATFFKNDIFVIYQVFIDIIKYVVYNEG